MNVYLSKELLTMESMRYVFGFIRTTGVVNVDQIECQLQNLINALQAEQQAHNALREKLKSIEWEYHPSCMNGGESYYCRVCKSSKMNRGV